MSAGGERNAGSARSETVTPREVEVMRLFEFERLSYKEIAHRLGIALDTVSTHLKNARRKLDVQRSRDAAHAYQQMASDSLPIEASGFEESFAHDVPEPKRCNEKFAWIDGVLWTHYEGLTLPDWIGTVVSLAEIRRSSRVTRRAA